MKVIFLDIDGVLNKRFSLMTPNGDPPFEKEGVDALNHIIARTGAKIVVSSAVRKGKMIVELRELLRKNGVEGVVIDKTPLISMSRRRGHEIQAWLDDYAKYGRDPVTSFVILDDDSDMEHLMPYLVQTWFEVGLTMEQAEKAIEVLKKMMPGFKASLKWTKTRDDQYFEEWTAKTSIGDYVVQYSREPGASGRSRTCGTEI